MRSSRKGQTRSIFSGPPAARCLIALLASILLAASPLRAQYLVKKDKDLLEHKGPSVRDPQADSNAPLTLLDAACGLFTTAWYGQPIPGGTLLVGSYGKSVDHNAAGQAVFYSDIGGSPRNQGIFVKDAAGIHPIVIGCGSYIGSGFGAACGDPSPIGGTFTSLHHGGVFPPSINDAGDVLFLADLFGGSSPRGLFLYKKATGTIVKVAAIGDPSPVGNLDALAGGSLNNNDEVAFLGGPGNSNQQMAVLHWKNGVLRLVVKPGHQIPGGTVTSLVWFGFNAPDSTYIPFAELPDINDSGAISFYAVLNGTIEGLFVSRDGVHELYVQTGQETPAGGAFFSLYAPILNNAGEIAFSGEYKLDPWTAGWFVGRPGRWRQVLSFYDRLQGGQAWGIAVSHNPQQPLDDDGNLIVWSDVMVDGGSSLHTVNVGYSDGTFETIVKGGDPSPMGGMIGELYAWPTLRSRFCGIEASLFGIPGVYGAYLESLKRPMQVTDLTLGAPDPLSESSLLSWTGQPSSSDGSLGYDVARGRLGGFGEPAACAADHLAGTSWVDPPAGCLAPPGEGCWYLVRAEDSCGRGSYGAEGTLCTDPCGGGPLGCPYCGDGRVAGTESCDGADFAGESCVTKGFDGGSLECTPNCTLNLSGCLTNCGDGMVRGSEQCDGTNLKNQWCPTLGFNRGILSCSETCTFDTSGCCCTDGRPGCAVCPVCGNNVREPPFEFCDGTFTNGETCMSQGRPPGTLLCNFRCDGYDYSGCTGYEAMNPFPLHPLSTPGTDANP